MAEETPRTTECGRCHLPLVNGRGGCEGAQHGNKGCAMNNPPAEEPSNMVDLLIERMGTHPEEFFDKETLLFHDVRKDLKRSFVLKWNRVMMGLLDMDGSLRSVFSDDEVKRFTDALRAAKRKCVDEEILRTLMSGEAWGGEPMNVPAPQATKNNMSGTSISGNTVPWPSTGITNYTAQEIEKEALRMQEEYMRQSIKRSIGMANANAYSSMSGTITSNTVAPPQEPPKEWIKRLFK